jgi:uncharacterized membrane protein YhdT
VRKEEARAAAKLAVLFTVWAVGAYGLSRAMGFPKSARWAEHPAQYVGASLVVVLLSWWAIRRLQHFRKVTGDPDETFLALQWFASFFGYSGAAFLMPIWQQWGLQSAWLDAAAFLVAAGGCLGTTLVLGLAVAIDSPRSKGR